MKILHAISSVNPKTGGPIEGVKQLQRAMQDRGIVTEIVCQDAPDAPFLETTELHNVHALGPARFGTYSYTSKLIPWLTQHAQDYDAVIIDGLWQYNSFAVWQTLKKTNTPYFVFTHGMLDPWFKKKYPIKHLKKWIYWPWGQYPVLRDAKAVLFTCEEEKLRARKSFWFYKAHEIVVAFGTMPPPDDAITLKDKFLSSFPSLRHKKVVLFISRIHPKKGCDLLIEAFARVLPKDPDLHLVMAGPDETGLRHQLEERAIALNIRHAITWTGMLSGEMKWGAYYASDVFCLPSHQENFGIVVAEALACGKPVLISDQVNIWREIQEDGVGFVDSDTIDGTQRNLEKWLGLDQTELSNMAKKSLNTFTNRFCIKKTATDIIELIEGAK